MTAFRYRARGRANNGNSSFFHSGLVLATAKAWEEQACSQFLSVLHPQPLPSSHMYTHTYTQIHTCTHIHSHIHTYTHTHTLTHSAHSVLSAPFFLAPHSAPGPLVGLELAGCPLPAQGSHLVYPTQCLPSWAPHTLNFPDCWTHSLAVGA